MVPFSSSKNPLFSYIFPQPFFSFKAHCQATIWPVPKPEGIKLNFVWPCWSPSSVDETWDLVTRGFPWERSRVIHHISLGMTHSHIQSSIWFPHCYLLSVRKRKATLEVCSSALLNNISEAKSSQKMTCSEDGVISRIRRGFQQLFFLIQ